MLKMEFEKVVIFVLEPGNIVKLKDNMPIATKLREPREGVVIAFSPDLEWVREQFERIPSPTPDQLIKLVEFSLNRPEVLR